jgi:hypothetical protein
MTLTLNESEQKLIEHVIIGFKETGWDGNIQYLEKDTEMSSIFKWLEDTVGIGYSVDSHNTEDADWAAFSLRSYAGNKVAFIFRDKNAAMHFKLVWC